MRGKQSTSSSSSSSPEAHNSTNGEPNGNYSYFDDAGNESARTESPPSGIYAAMPQSEVYSQMPAESIYTSPSQVNEVHYEGFDSPLD